jgi:hypothetical protein
MRKVVFLTCSIAFLIGVASGQMRSGNAFFGYSYYNSTNLSSPLFNRATTNGWEASVEGKILPFLGVVADLISARRTYRPVVRDAVSLGVLSLNTTTCSVPVFPCR